MAFRVIIVDDEPPFIRMLEKNITKATDKLEILSNISLVLLSSVAVKLSLERTESGSSILVVFLEKMPIDSALIFCWECQNSLRVRL
jgi:hypothetical protein